MQTSLPLSDRDPNTSGRNSRASHLSNGSKGAVRRSHHPQPTPSYHGHNSKKSKPPEGILSTGVLGMLRTTMEIGDVASLAVSNHRQSQTSHYSQPYYRHQSRRTGNGSRLSNGSSNSLSVDRSVNSYHRPWPSVSSAGRRRSITSNITTPPFLDPPHPPSSTGSYGYIAYMDRPDSPPNMQYGRPLSSSGRSLSMTNGLAAHNVPLSNYRSLSSLRGGGFREAYPRAQSPLRYPTRLKRPGYRPSSPALSDVAGAPSSRYLQTGGPSRSKAPNGYPNMPAPRYPAPYPTHRNRSAPTIATMLNISAPRNSSVRDDTPSLTDGSGRRGRTGGNHKQAMSIRSNRSSVMPSSDLPSSSSPQTPKSGDHVSPIIVGTQSSLAINSNSLLAPPPVAYYDYSEDYDFEKEVTEVYSEIMPDSPMPLGFLDRVRAILEEREKSSGVTTPEANASLRDSFHESVLLKLAELPATPVVSRRITRELIIAALGPSTDSLTPESVAETVTDMVSSLEQINGSLEVEIDEQNSDGSGDSYHSVTSHKHSLSFVASEEKLPKHHNFEQHADFQPSGPSVASFVPEDSDKDDEHPPITGSLFRVISLPPPPVLTAGNETIIDKVKRHWSLRRAAVAPLRARPGSSSMPEIPQRASSASQISRGSTTVADLDDLSIHRDSFSKDFLRASDLHIAPL
jgi:serine/arginine repetitive matrix protein 2